MGTTTLIRRVHFVATHHYGRPDADMEENQSRFGDQARPHSHEWTVEVRVTGPVNPDTGWITNLVELDRALDALMEGWDEGDLNERVPPVAAGDIQPSTEELARWLYGELAATVPRPAKLAEVRVFESPDLGAAHGP